MTTEQNKALDRRIFEAVNNKNLDALDDLIATDWVDHNLLPGLPLGLDSTKVTLSMYLSAFPDLKMTIEDQIAEGDKVVTRWTATGTHNGELMGIPATGKQVRVTGIDITRWSGGKSVEHWAQFDQMGLMQQLGVIPAPGEGGE